MPKLQDFVKDLTEKTTDESKKKKIILLYVLGLVVIFFIYVLIFLRPSITALTDLIPKIRKRGTEIKAVRDDLPFKNKLLAKRKAQQEILGQYEKKLSKEKEVPVLLENLSKIAKNSRVKILSITPLEPARAARIKDKGKKEGVCQEIPIRISAMSGYHELGTFINTLERDKRYMRVSDLKIKANRSSSKRHNVEFVVYAYTFKSGE